MSRMRSRFAAIVGVSVIASTGLVLGAPAASADQVWYQSVGRDSVDASCPVDVPDEIAAGWSPWTASWAEWMNGGKGGFTCDRSIVWAKSSPAGPSDIGCQQYGSGEGVYFGVTPWLPDGSSRWIGVTCEGAPSDTIPLGVVYAPEGETQAGELCATYAGVMFVTPFQVGPNVWRCDVT